MATAAAKVKQEGLLDVGDLCRLFEESEDASNTARKDAERDRDYLDHKQLTSDEIKELESRGQPAVTDNRIKTKIDYLVGLEKKQRVKPKAFPRTPKHEADADGATEALRYVAEEQDYENKRSGVWRNMLVEGFGGVRVYAEPSKYGQKVDYQNSTSLTQQEYDICIQRVAWDRLFYDPHSSEVDFSDAGYLGIVTWMDHADALALYKDNPDAAEILETTLQTAPSDTYDDKPKFNHWADKKRKRVRICQIWVKRDEQWYFAEYTKGGILKAGLSQYVTDRGESDCELILQGAYVDRDNNRYGLVREMISLQDEINKRRSKSLDLLVRNQTTYEKGAVADIEKFRREKAKTDGTMEVNVGALSNPNGPKIISETKSDLSTAHFQLLQEAKNSIDLKGPNATEMGDKAGAGGSSSSASGRAILASQQGGMIQIGDLMDGLRHLDKRVFRAAWARVRQFWTAQKWIRVTDDEQNVKWLGLNVPPEHMQMIAMQSQQDPEAAKKIAGMVGSVAELDCDIIIDDAPDSLTPQGEQFENMVKLKQFDTENELPLRSLIRAMPNLKDKQAILKEIDERREQNAQAKQAEQQLALRGANAEVAGAEAKVGETQSKTALNMAKAQAEGMPDQMAPQQVEPEEPFAAEKALAEIGKLVADAEHKRAQAHKTNVDASLAPQQAAHQAQMDRVNLAQSAHDNAEQRKLAAKKQTQAA